MIFYCDLQGNLKAFQNETVYQGSNNVTTIYVVAPFNRPVGLNISFTKPNKLVTSPAIMKWVGTLGNVKIPVSFVNIPEQFTETYNVWAYALPYSITEQNGVVGVSVNAVIADSVDASGQQAYKGNLTTFTGQFTVAYSALPSPPTDIPTEWTQDKVLDLLNNYYNDAIQKIGEMNTLKTNAKDTLVKAINEVFDEIAATNATIGNLSTLTTDEKTTIVGAINEVDQHADANKAEIGDLSALTTDEKATLVGAINEVDNHADNATTLANNAVAEANNAVATANGAKTIAEQAKTIATNSVYSVSFEDIQSAVTALNGYDNAYFKVGNSIYLKQKDVPDMWVYAVASEYVEYTYTTDDDFVNALLLGTVQVGYYVLANLESTGDYDVLKNKPIINQDLSADGFAPVENTYYRHTGTTSETYTNGVIYFYNGTAYKAIDGAGGEVPTSLPATGAKITGNLPTSGWDNLSIPMWEGNEQGTAFANAQTLKLKTSWASVSDIPITGWTETYFFNAGVQINEYIQDWNVTREDTYVELKFDGSTFIYIYPNGTAKFFSNSASAHRYYLKQIKQENTTISRYTISDTAIKTNSTVSMYLNSADEVRAISKTDGSVVVEMDAVPTTAIPYTLQVVETSAEGAFEIVNSYVPTIPESPTALPQTASALKNGNLPTSGWTQGDIRWYWEQENDVVCSASSYTFITNNTAIANKCWNEQVSTIAHKASYSPSTQTMSYNNSQSTEDYRLYGSTGKYSLRVYKNGDIYGKGYTGSQNMTFEVLAIGFPDVFEYLYTISDTSITANSDILMELTDEGGVKAYSMEAGKMTVIRDTVPTQPIPYTYKVKQTNASGQFTLLNHYVPKVEIPTIPTKTSELINDSGFVSNLPIVRNVVCNDVESATTLDTTITCEVGDLILAQIIVRSALTLPTGWTLLRTIPAVETSYNQTLSFAYKKATSTSETLTVTQASAGRIYTNLVRLSNAVSISYIQSCEKTNTGAVSISSTKPVTPNMVIWGASSTLWQSSSPYGNWSSSPSTLDYYSLSQSTKAPRLGTFIDSSGAGERTFSTSSTESTNNAMMCGAVEIVGDEVARKGDIPTVTTLYEDSTGAATVTLSETINNGDIVRIKTNNGNVDNYYIGVAWNRAITVTESLMVTDESDVTVGTAINIYSLRFNIQDTSLILFHYFKTNITTAGAVTITNEKANVVIRKVERIHA